MCAVVHCTHHQSKCVPIVHDQQLACLHASQHLCLLSQQVCQSQGIDVSVMADLISGVAELLQAKVENLHSGHEGCPRLLANTPAKCSFQPLFAQMSGQLHQTWQHHNNRNKLMKGVFVCTLTRPCLGRPRLR